MSATPDVVAAAVEQVEQGFAAFALKANAKVPVTEHGFKNATTKPDWIATQLKAPPAGNYGITWPEDAERRVLAFDLDNGSDGSERPWQDRLLELIAKIGPLPATRTTTTPSGGRHAFYEWPLDVPIPPGDELFGFTVRWPGRGYLVGPGSSIDGRAYVAGPEQSIVELPRAWVDAALAERRGVTRGTVPSSGNVVQVTGSYELPDHIPSGRRYAAVRDYVASRYNAGLSLEELWDLVVTQVAPRFESAKTEDELRADFERVTAKIGDRLGPPARGQRQQPSTAQLTPEQLSASSIDAVDLLALDIPPLEWIVPDLVPEGTTILAGPPKLGKSCLVYQIAVEVAMGGELLGRDITQGDVLYLALEDGKRRGQTRLRASLGDRPMPRGRLEVRWSASKIGAGLEEELLDWLDAHPLARLVAVDTLQRVRGRSDSRRNAYEVDVEDLGRLQSLFRDRAVGLLVVHHSKKDAGDDFLASVSGTYGITGSADTTLVIQRKRLEAFGKLVVTGRDVEEVEQAVQFNGMTWSMAPRSLAEASFEQAEVYKVIEAQGPVFPAAIATAIGSERTAVQHLVEKLVAVGSVVRTTGGYVTTAVRVVGGGVSEQAENDDSAHSAHSEPRARAHAGVPAHSAHSAHSGEVDGVSPVSGDTRNAHAHPRERRPNQPVLTIVTADAGTWAAPCHFYDDHRSAHTWTAAGWICTICAPAALLPPEVPA